MTQREKHRKYYKAYMRNIRLLALKAVANGGSVCCARCGFNDVRALQFDHIEGNGSEHRKQRHFACQYLDIARGRNTVPVQILCANCNWIKRHEDNESPGRPILYDESQGLLFEEEQ